MHPDDTNVTDEEEFPKEHLEGTSLTALDWQKAQASGSNINLIVDHLPTATQVVSIKDMY